MPNQANLQELYYATILHLYQSGGSFVKPGDEGVGVGLDVPEIAVQDGPQELALRLCQCFDDELHPWEAAAQIKIATIDIPLIGNKIDRLKGLIK